MSKTDKKTATKKMSQAERDALFGSDDTTVVVGKPAAKTDAKPALKPKVEAKPAGKAKAKTEAKPAGKVEPKPKAEVKPVAKAEAGEHGRKVASDSRKLKSVGKCEAREKSVVAQIFEAFSGGKVVSEAIEDLVMTFDPPRSKAYKGNERKYLMGYISFMVGKGMLATA